MLIAIFILAISSAFSSGRFVERGKNVEALEEAINSLLSSYDGANSSFWPGRDRAINETMKSFLMDYWLEVRKNKGARLAEEARLLAVARKQAEEDARLATEAKNQAEEARKQAKKDAALVRKAREGEEAERIAAVRAAEEEAKKKIYLFMESGKRNNGGSGLIQFVDGFCLAMKDGVNIVAEPCSNDSNQIFYYDARPKEGDPVLDEEMATSSRSVVGMLLYLLKHSRIDLGNPVRELTIRSKLNNKCLDVHPGTKNVYAAECHAGNTQRWYLGPEGRLTSHILFNGDRPCLDRHLSTSNVYAHPCNDGDNQRMIFPTKLIR